MSNHPTESKRLLSYTIAEWACALKYEHLSPAAIQAAKLFWFDSIGCALGGSQQDDAKILLKHYRAMGGWQRQIHLVRLRLQDQSGRCVVSEWPHDPRHGLQRHLLEGRSLSPERPHRRAAGALRKRRPGRPGFDSRHDHRLRNRNASVRSGPAGRARIRLASRHLERVRGADRGGSRAESHAGADGLGHGHQRVAHILSGRGHGGQADQHEEHGRSVGGTHGRRERAPGSRRIFRSRAHHRWQGRTLCRVQACALQGRTSHVRRRGVGRGSAQLERRRTTAFSIAA